MGFDAVSAVETYLDRLHEIHSRRKGTPELSFRAALENLINAVGETLDPPVRADAELTDTGGGRPDFGFFEAKSGKSRGVAEVKGPADDVPNTADGRQVTRYGEDLVRCTRRTRRGRRRGRRSTRRCERLTTKSERAHRRHNQTD